MDAANVDLKAFPEDFYRVAREASPVLSARVPAKHRRMVRIANLLIPGLTLGPRAHQMTRWVVRASAPACRCTSPRSTDWKMLDRPTTLAAALSPADRVGGVRYAYWATSDVGRHTVPICRHRDQA
jgi:pyruvate-formate lyase-activating enzyme